MAGDPKAFATVVQFADKVEVFKRETQNHDELAASTIEHIQRRLAELAKRPPEAQESTPQKES